MARQQTVLLEFEEKYEDLVDLLCWAAKEGVHGDMAARYAELRSWMKANYRYIRSYLHPFWSDSVNHEDLDPFEVLFSAEEVDNVINAFTGISALMSSREALVACYASMEQS